MIEGFDQIFAPARPSERAAISELTYRSYYAQRAYYGMSQKDTETLFGAEQASLFAERYKNEKGVAA